MIISLTPSIIGAALLGFPEPLLPLHLLWINLVTDGPPATALGFNPADPGVMQQRPRSKNQSILTKWMLIRYIVTGAYVGLAAISCYYSWFASRGVSFAQLRAWESCDEWTSIFTTNNHNAVGKLAMRHLIRELYGFILIARPSRDLCAVLKA